MGFWVGVALGILILALSISFACWICCLLCVLPPVLVPLCVYHFRLSATEASITNEIRSTAELAGGQEMRRLSPNGMDNAGM
mmetsp:Transcript_7546/g.9749  ORF Transcript_7546/g.9749 Transcript_7546/m.9749 type:complete len:82 (+) Transcript_7546:1-246(+)